MDKMSAAILMTDSWQPTVLQLMPFTSNNASHVPSSPPDRTRGYSQARGFPTLAVTRTRSKKDGGKPIRVSSERMPRAAPPPSEGFPPQRARSEYNTRVKSSLVTTERVYTVNNVNSRIMTKTPELNDSPDSSDNLSSSDVSKNVKLPKPSPCRSVDGRYFLPQNGFWRSVTMTPGEMDLQKHRDKFVKENVQSNKNKKYKLNVNQLPRSTTPINDNDPDKLNMKQVIRFLQTKEGPSSPTSTQSPIKFERRVKSSHPTTAPSRVAVRDSVESEVRHTDTGVPTMLPFRREVTSVMYTSNSSHPHSLKKRGQHKHKRDGDSVTKSNDNTNCSSFKNTREFRLHRFLTMAPNADEFTHVTQNHPISSAHKRLLITECSRSADIETDSMRNSCSPVPPYLPSRHGERYAKLHYRLPNRRTELNRQHMKTTSSGQLHRQSKDTALVKEGIIRLPSMLDFNNDSDNEDHKDDIKWKKNIQSVTRNTISPDPPSLEVNGRDSTPSSSDKDVFSDSEGSTKPPSRRVTVSLPRESQSDTAGVWERTRQSSEPVRLSLRQEHLLTREKTYMSDMVKHKEDPEGYESETPRLPSMTTKRDTHTKAGSVC